jgi:hypothetical protein
MAAPATKETVIKRAMRTNRSTKTSKSIPNY